MAKQALKFGLRNLRGDQIGDLYVVRKLMSKITHWECKCVCGNVIKVKHSLLIRTGNPKSHCGCKNRGLSYYYKKEYHAYWDAKQRCHDPNHPSYPYYGFKGIRMCGEWRESFEAFFNYIGKRPDKGSLDRIDPFGDYKPGNVRWISMKEQARNKKGTKYVKHPKTGKDITIGALAEEYGITYHKMYKMLHPDIDPNDMTEALEKQPDKGDDNV